jgi:ribosome-binding protein aMBF1 (putative translation factor)
MQLHTKTLNALAQRLNRERQLQGLSRDQLAAVSNLSASFIRDAESNPGRCSLERLLQLTEALGLKAMLGGWQNDVQSSPKGDGSSKASSA